MQTGGMKLDDSARKCAFVEYTETASIWRLYDPLSKRVFTSRDVKFFVTSFPYRIADPAVSWSTGPRLVPLTTCIGYDIEEQPELAVIQD
jgi:hypothetical protein